MKLKRAVIAPLMACALFSAQTMADDDIGCGLGSMVFAGQEGKVFKVLGATTNGTSGNQTFGITFGTLGCDGTGTITSDQKLAMFIDGNMDNLARDIAVGQGETLATLSEVWGIPQEQQPEFNQFAKSNFATIFHDENTTSDQVLNRLNTMLKQQDSLAAYAI